MFHHSAAEWKADVDEHASIPGGGPLPVFILCNKAELLEDPQIVQENANTLVSRQDLTSFVSDNKCKGGYFTSAKTGYNVETAFLDVFNEVHANLGSYPSPKKDIFVQVKPSSDKPKKRGCC